MTKFELWVCWVEGDFLAKPRSEELLAGTFESKQDAERYFNQMYRPHGDPGYYPERRIKEVQLQYI